MSAQTTEEKEQLLCDNFEFLFAVCTTECFDFAQDFWLYPCDEKGFAIKPAIGPTGNTGPFITEDQLKQMRLARAKTSQKSLATALPWLNQRCATQMISLVMDFLIIPPQELIEPETERIKIKEFLSGQLRANWSLDTKAAR